MKKRICVLLALMQVFLLAACGNSGGQEATTQARPEGIRNIILIIGDGTGDAQLEAGELASGTTYVFRDWQHTHANTNSLMGDGTAGKVTDSAAGGTALATGQLTINGRVGIGPKSDEYLKTILDYAKEYGKSTGVVTTDTIHGATPAAFSGHTVDRTDTTTILYTQMTSQVDLLCANRSVEAMEMESYAVNAGYAYTTSFKSIGETMESEKAYWQLNISDGSTSESLETVVPYALDFLDKDPDGFAIMIEQAHVDKYCHKNEIQGTEICSNSLNNTVAAILQWLGDREDTAIIITADHETGGLSVSREADYLLSYRSAAGNQLYYQYASVSHTDTPVSVYIYGFEADLTPYYLDEEKTLIKNTSVFSIMLDLLENPVRE